MVLILSPEDDVEIVFRLINLWFNNSSKNEVNEGLSKILTKISVHKFVPLTYLAKQVYAEDLKSSFVVNRL